ncbi:MAG TPA: VOC family protein [Candidatus Acidoferrales bacterium]|nr:VOC family protein [Candidatus Acidoferrales bacterium]
MIGYVTLGSNDVERALLFYDAVLGELGARRGFNNDRLQFYAAKGAMLAIGKTYDGNPASVGNGTMVALAARDRETVDRVHAKALSLGAVDEGAPGERSPAFYGAYFRDPDGNKLCIFHYTG